MELHGKHLIGSHVVAGGPRTFVASDPRTGTELQPAFAEGTGEEVDRALQLAAEAAMVLRRTGSEQIAAFLLAVRDQILALGDILLERAMQESGLDRARLTGERTRTLNQIKMFADLVTEGSWVDARIETALPHREPLPRPDLRRMLMPIGPVAVFGASNFPLAFSVAGGDTIAAFAARNPVVVKGHPSHPGTSELVAGAIVQAIHAQGMPPGMFSLLQSTLPEISLAVVRHPETKAVGFTGSLRAGRALMDEAARRPAPIPVYAEMGSVNPIFILPEALQKNGAAIGEGLFKSATAGVGQFCTCPGLVFAVAGSDLDRLHGALTEAFRTAPAGTMLNANVSKSYHEKARQFASITGVETVAGGEAQGVSGQPFFFATDYATWSANQALHEEIFGPATVLVRVNTQEELSQAARQLDGSLTATIHATPGELQRSGDLADAVSQLAGRVILNGFPTGVEVGSAMNHGGPYPATADEKFTSVGTASILRFARPVCYQGFPASLLQAELQDANPRQIWRTVNGTLTREPLSL